MALTNRVYKVLATVGGSSAASVAALTAGQYVITKKDGTPYTAGQTVSASDTFQIVVGDQNGQPVFSDPIAVKDVTSFAKRVYAAKVEQVSTVTVGTPVAGIEYSLLINNRSDKEILPMRQSLRRYTVLATAADTASTIATAFTNKINADTKGSIVTASVAGAVITLTAINIAATKNLAGDYYDQIFFDVELSAVDNNGYFQSFGSVALSAAPNFGSGNYFQVRQLENDGLGYTGVTNRTLFPVDTANYLSVPGTNYDVYVIESANTHETGSVTVGRVKAPITTIVAVATGQTAAFEAIIAPLIQSGGSETLGAEI